MPFWIWTLIVILWWSFHVRSGSITQVTQAAGLYFNDSNGDANDTLHQVDENPETSEELEKLLYAEQGDILTTWDRNAVSKTWKTTKIPYTIHDKLKHRSEDIAQATHLISEHTCVTFHQHQTENDFLFFKNHRGCASYVGCIGGKQPVFIGQKCGVGNIVHEIMHALGFYHEHTRLDRDDYIKVLTQNIREGAEKNFVKQSGDTGNIPYDTNSILHYGKAWFSSNGQPTIEALKPAAEMGQRERLTGPDIERIRILYKCDSPKNGPTAENEK